MCLIPCLFLALSGPAGADPSFSERCCRRFLCDVLIQIVEVCLCRPDRVNGLDVSSSRLIPATHGGACVSAESPCPQHLNSSI